jgi:serine protease Do
MRARTLVFIPILVAFALMVAVAGCDSPTSNQQTAGSSATATATTTSIARSNTQSSNDLQPEPAVNSVEAVRPSVVHIQAQGLQSDPFGREIPQEGIGTGVIYDADGNIITNNHVVTLGTNRPADEVIVSLTDGRTFDARVIGRDPLTDLAVVKINTQNLTPAVIGSASSLRIGQQVWAIGHALGLPGGPTVTRGVVSAKERFISEPNGVTLSNLIQTDAAINPGNSGGPLITDSGEVVGINTAGIEGAQDIGFAISSETFKPIVDELIASGRVQRGALGVSIVDLSPAIARALNLNVTEGVVIRSVTRGGPAEQAGLRAGDVVTGIEGTTIRNSGELASALQKYKPADTVAVSFARDGNQQTAQVKLTNQQSTPS